MQPLKYLAGYPEHLQQRARELLDAGKLGEVVRGRHPQAHAVRNDRQLHDYVQELKARHLRQSPPLGKVLYDGKLHVVQHALGTHTTRSRVQGSRLVTRREIRIASLFRDAPADFLKMIVVHELAHMKHAAHDKAFYQLCCRIEPAYHQLEFDVRAWLCWVEAGGAALWGAAAVPPSTLTA